MRARPSVCALVVAAMLAAGSTRAQGTDDARSHFTRAVELFKEGDFRAAHIEFGRAYEAAPNYKVLYNLGQTSLELQDYAGALKAFRGYLDGGGHEVSAARKTQVENELKKLESRVARVEVTVNVEGADISIDDVSVGKSPLREPVLVGAGRRRITVLKSGLAAVTRMIDVAGGDKSHVTIDLVEPQSPSTVIVQQQPTESHPPVITPPPIEPPHERVTSGPSTAFYVGLTTTIVLGVATGVLGGFALASKSDFDSKVGQVGVKTSDIDGARDQTRSFALATDIVGIVGIAAAVTTVVLAVTTSSKHREALRASVFISPFGFGVRGAM